MLKFKFLKPATILIIATGFIFQFCSIAIAVQTLSICEIDSTKLELNICKADTCQFYILHKLFWKNKFAGNPNAEYYGNWAFQIIRNSKNLHALSDGYDIKANLLLSGGKIDSAYSYLSKALEVSEKIGYKYRAAWSCCGLAEINASNYNKPGLAVFYFKKSIQNFSLINDVDDIACINSKLAFFYRFNGKVDSSVYYYNKNIELFKNHTSKAAEVYNYLNFYDLYKTNNNGKKAVENLYLAMNKAEALNDEMLLTLVYENIGIFCFEQKKYSDMAISFLQKALILAEKNNRTDIKATVCNLISKVYFEEKNDSLSLEYNIKGLKASKEINYKCIMSDSYKNLGKIYRKLGNDKASIENFKLSYYKSPDICSHDALIAIGDLYLKNNDLKNALEWYNKSLFIADSVNAAFETAKSKFSLGNYYWKGKNNSLAEKMFNEAFSMAKKAKNIELIKNISDVLAGFYISNNDYKSAVYYLQTSKQMADSLFLFEKQASLSNLENRFEFEKLKSENDQKELRAKEEIKKQRTYLLFSILITLLLSGLIIVVLINYKRKRNDNQLLLKQKNEIEKISKQLHEADEMKLQFFTNISHELRTPLTLIISPLIKFLNREEIRNPAKLYSMMLRNARKLQALINQLIDISKLDKGELKLNLNKYNFNKLVRITAANFESIAEEKNIYLEIIENQSNIIFDFDAERIEQVLNNLLSNAVKFTPEAGNIAICVSCSNVAELRVKNTGPGIQANELDRIFTRFYRSRTAIESNIEGSGIGLAFAKELVELHNGKISVLSKPGKWTEFTVVLPLLNSEDIDTEICFDAEYIPAYNENTEEEISHLGRNPVLLLVEDNIDLRSYLSESLSAEYKVFVASDGNEGTQMAHRLIPDVIISDVMMPGLDGIQMISALKENIKTSHIPVILLTAKASRDSKIKGLESGADDYILKPFDEEELKLKIRNLLNTRKKLQEKFRRQITANPSEIEVKSMDEQFLLKLTAIIEQDIANPKLDTDFVSLKIGLSKAQLYRKLKALTDISINQFIRSIRLKRAAQLLEKRTATVSEIAYQTGFESLSYFTTKFKEQFGKLPSDY